MNRRLTWKRNAQLFVVVLCAALAKLYYSTASVNQLRWILAPTTVVVELVSGSRFEFESYEGYINSDRSFVIAASCAGVNFLITSFLMLSLRKLWRARSQNRSHDLAWRFIPTAAVFAYLATLVANTVRISTALQLHGMPLEIGWLSPNQLHRFEGIFIYFGFLLLLFMVSEKVSLENASSSQDASISQDVWSPLRRTFFPLLVYYTTTLGIPLVNGAYRQGIAATDFWEHSVFVLLTPLLLIFSLGAVRVYSGWATVQPAGGYTKSEPGAVATGSFSRRSTKSVTSNSGVSGENERLSLRTDPVATASGSDSLSPGSNFF